MKKFLLFFLSFFSFAVSLFLVVPAVVAVDACDADIDGDRVVDLSDYSILVLNFFRTGSGITGDINNDNLVDISDYAELISVFFQFCTPASTPTVNPTAIPTATSVPGPTATPGQVSQGDTWHQDGGNAQRTSFSSYDPGSSSNWQLAWSWNGPDSSGGTGEHFYDIGRSDAKSLIWEGRTVMGNGNVYVPALSNGVYALNKTSGSQVWNFSDNTSFKSTPAYDAATNAVFVGGENGKLYKLNATNGNNLGSYSTGSPIKKSVLVAGNAVYVVTDAGDLYKIQTSNMSLVWKYQSGSKATTPPAYSANKDVLIFTTYDLNVHAVKNSDGSRKWRVKPSSLSGSDYNTFEGYWPVIAEKHGIVLVRMNVGGNVNSIIFGGPGTSGMYPATSAETKTFLNANTRYKNLYALNLEDGSEAFTPAVGPGGTESLLNGNAIIVAPPVPVIKVLPDGKEVAYVHFRSSQGTQYDGRWDSKIGEMVLDSSTISGLNPGDVRFVSLSNSQTSITDEQTPISMAGDVLFNAHWGASSAHKILDRSDSKGLTNSNPITSTSLGAVIRRMSSCGTKNTSTHKSSCSGGSLFDDGRYWGGTVWWTYWNVLDPPTPSRGAYSEGLLPRYTYASDGVMVVEGNGGELMVFKTQ